MSRRHDISWSASQMRGAGSRTEGGIMVPTMNTHNNVLSFLAIVDYYGFDFIDAKWKQGLDVLGLGGTAEVRELFITNKKMFAYKRHRALATTSFTDAINWARNRDGDRCPHFTEKIFNELVSELTILGHPLIRNHQNIVSLVGIHWDLPDNSDPWPVLVFDRAHHGDMWSFATSTKGLAMNFKDRLGICLDIAQALTALHDLDIKPQNILVFFDDASETQYFHQPEITHAKLADFGYAAWNMDSSKEIFIYLPESKPWTAPEYHPRAFSLQQAKQLEIFSFGLSCFWFLFHDKIADMSRHLPTHLAEMCREATVFDSKLIEKLKNHGVLAQLACSLVKAETSLCGVPSDHLITFFNSTLNMASQIRNLLVQNLASAAGYEAAYSLRCLDIEQRNLDNSILSFSVAENFQTLMIGPYRVREYLASCWKGEALNGWTLQSKQNAAFQYSLCCKLGVGRPTNEEESRTWLRTSHRSTDDLQIQVSIIRRGANQVSRMHRTANFSIAGEPGILDNEDPSLKPADQRSVWRREIEDLSQYLDPYCRLLVTVRRRLILNLLDSGQLDEAENILMPYIEHAVAHGLKTAEGEYKTDIKAQKELYNEEMSRRVKKYTLDLAASRQERIRNKVGALNLQQPGVDACSTEFVRLLKVTEYLLEIDMHAVILLARLYRRRRMWREAEIVLIQARNILSNSSCEWDDNMWRITQSLGTVYFDSGRLTEAESVYSFLAAVFDMRHGPGHPITLSIKRDIVFLQSRQNLRLNESYLQEMQVRLSRVYGRTEGSTRHAMAMRADLYNDQRRYREAEELHRQLLSMPDTLDFGIENRVVLMNNLGLALEGQKRFEEAEVSFRASLQLGGTFNGIPPGEATSRLSISNLARLLQEIGKLTDSASLLEHLVGELSAKLPVEHEAILETKNKLSLIYHQLGRFEDEEQLFLSTIKSITELYGPRHPTMIHWKYSLAIIYQRQTRFHDAERLKGEAVAVISEHGAQEDPTLLRLELNLAWVHYGQKRFMQVAQALTGKIDVFIRDIGLTGYETQEAVYILTSSLAATKKYAEAEKLSVIYLEAVMKPQCKHLVENRLAAIAMRAEILLAQGKWGTALLFISHHVSSLTRWYWMNLKWCEVRPVLRFLFNPRYFPNNAYIMGFLVTSIGGLLFGLYTISALFFKFVKLFL